MTNIIFVGDSYCASTSSEHYDANGRQQFQDYKPYPGHPAIVADHYGVDLYSYGYAGKSWWYSYRKFQQALKNNPNRLADALAVVFFHTDASRINSMNQELTSLHLPQHFGQLLKRVPIDTELAEASRLWVRHLYDIEFQDWAERQYFMELARQYSKVKTIHFHCFDASVIYSDLLPGRIYTTPLYIISDNEPGQKQPMGDTRANHLNEQNNLALADVIIQAIDRYTPGQYPIPLEGFDIV
jgi:hypothetical protein